MAKQARGGLGLWDRLVLLVAWVVTCGLVYLLGIYVGKGMQERLLGSEERVVRLPVTGAPLPEGNKPKAEKELTFYDTLVKDAESGRAPTPAESGPRPMLPPSPPATTARAASGSAPTPAPPTPALARQTPPVPPPPPARATPSATLPLPTAATLPRKEPMQPVVPPPPAPEPAASLPTVPGATRPLGGNWTVLANPTRSGDEAETLARQLRSRGYAANVVSVAREGGTWYRVAVGRFASSEQATEMMQRLREREGVAHVFVAAE
jgi:cell division septation protein DedD